MMVVVAVEVTEQSLHEIIGKHSRFEVGYINFQPSMSGLQGGLPCVWMDARDVIVVTPTGKLQVDPVYEASAEKLDKWYSRYPSDTVIVTGFIASTTDDIPTTLKRDGSDLSAAIMGSLFQASRVTIWTDVDGVFSADPRKGNVFAVLYVTVYLFALLL